MKIVFEVWRLELMRELIDLLNILSIGELTRPEFIDTLKTRVESMSLISEDSELRDNAYHELAAVAMVALVQMPDHDSKLRDAATSIKHLSEEECDALIFEGINAIAQSLTETNPPEEVQWNQDRNPFF